MGTLVTLDLPDGSPALVLPWIITFGPLNDDELWEPVVCGPYVRDHALALAEAVVADEELMAVVEPLQPSISVDQIRGEIAGARMATDEAEDADIEDDEDDEHDHEHGNDAHEHPEHIEPSDPPSPEEIRAGFARIAAQLTS